MKKPIDMLHGNVMSSLLRFALPLVLTGWLQMLFNSADSLVVGRFAGSAALAAVGATFAFVMLVISFFGGLAAGVTVCAANDVGAGDAESYRETMHVSVLLALIIGVCVMALGEGICRPILRMMHAPEDIIDSAVTYLRIYFLCMPAQMVYNTGASLLRARGDSRRPLFFLALSGACNVALNVLFVAAFKWNVVGVAAATVITQYLSAFLVLRAHMREETAWRLEPGKLCLRKKKIARILKIGVPAGLQVSMLAASDIPLQTAVNSLGSLAVSGNAAALNIDGLIFSTIESLTQACTVFTGQCVGARMFDRTRTVFKDSLLITVTAGLVFGAIGSLLRYQIVALFLPNAPEAVAFGADRALAVSTFVFIYSVMGTINASLRGYGISLPPALVNIVALFGFRLVWAFAYFPKHPTLFHLYISYPIAWLIAIALLLVIYRPLVRRAREKLEAERAAPAAGE
ncbi:MAG: MATE family efflux transporter [Oscillospiraceae bacterium]|nr:MATE family efflux transporter [Oscillospiraceae bacterium]